MVLPKVTRQRLYAAKGAQIEITIPEGEPCAKWHRYSIQAKRGGRRLATLFVCSLEHRGTQRIATVELTDQPEFMAKVSGSTPDASQSIDKEAEMVPSAFQKKITAEANARFTAQQESARQSQPLEARLARVRAEAHRRGVDVTRLDASIEKRIHAYERRTKDAA